MGVGASFLRQQDLIDGEALAALPIFVIGAGAVGSFTALSLAKMGAANLTCFDNDLVEPHNLPNQFYRLSDVGKPKVEALREIILDYTGVEIQAFPEKYEHQRILQGVVIVAVDSMDCRKMIWRSVRRQPPVDLLIDARMGAEVAQIHTVSPLFDVADYEKTLYTSAEAIHEPCTRKAVIYTAMGIACFICGRVKAYIQNEPFSKTLVADFKQDQLLALI